MKILIFSAYYEHILNGIYRQRPSFKSLPYEKLRKRIYQYQIGNGESYAFYLSRLGHQVEEYFYTDQTSQQTWLRDNDIHLKSTTKPLSESLEGVG